MTPHQRASLKYARSKRGLRKMKAWRDANVVVIRKKKRAVYKRTRAQVRDHNLRTKYGMTLADLEQMLRDQDGKCAVCKIVLTAAVVSREEQTSLKAANVDHDHATGRVRGVLCFACNHAAGLLGDSAERCAMLGVYLKTC